MTDKRMGMIIRGLPETVLPGTYDIKFVGIVGNDIVYDYIPTTPGSSIDAEMHESLRETQKLHEAAHRWHNAVAQLRDIAEEMDNLLEQPLLLVEEAARARVTVWRDRITEIVG
jgi:hypothetical protein